MINLAEGFKRIWIILWAFGFVTILIFASVETHLPFANEKYHYKVEPDKFAPHYTDDQSDFAKNLLAFIVRSHCTNKVSILDEYKMLCEESTTTEWKEWDRASKILAITTKQYWNSVLVLLALLASWTLFWWGIWFIGTWITRGFKANKVDMDI